MGVERELKALVDSSATTAPEIRDFLDELSAEQRRDAIRTIHGSRRHGKLYELAAAGPIFTIDDLVSASLGPLGEVIFYGQNSLPMGSQFEKRMCRPAPNDHLEGHLIGYNHYALKSLVGPGYFVVRNSAADPDSLGPVVIDYTQVPSQKPIHWPEIKTNERSLSRFVYAHMLDYLRALSADVFIGRAVRHGKVTHNYFILSRA